MPIIHFYGPEMSKETKANLGEKLTNTAAELLPHVPKEAFIVVIHEKSLDNFAVGGKLVSQRMTEEHK